MAIQCQSSGIRLENYAFIQSALEILGNMLDSISMQFLRIDAEMCARINCICTIWVSVVSQVL